MKLLKAVQVGGTAGTAVKLTFPCDLSQFDNWLNCVKLS